MTESRPSPGPHGSRRARFVAAGHAAAPRVAGWRPRGPRHLPLDRQTRMGGGEGMVVSRADDRITAGGCMNEPRLDRERWLRIKHLFAEVASLPSAERVRFLAVACPDDEPMRREIDA